MGERRRGVCAHRQIIHAADLLAPVVVVDKRASSYVAPSNLAIIAILLRRGTADSADIIAHVFDTVKLECRLAKLLINGPSELEVDFEYLYHYAFDVIVDDGDNLSFLIN